MGTKQAERCDDCDPCQRRVHRDGQRKARWHRDRRDRYAAIQHAATNIAAASGAGSDTSAARSDHTHGHGDQTGGTLHATATAATPGFMSNTDKGKPTASRPARPPRHYPAHRPQRRGGQRCGIRYERRAQRPYAWSRRPGRRTLHATTTPASAGFMAGPDKGQARWHRDRRDRHAAVRHTAPTSRQQALQEQAPARRDHTQWPRRPSGRNACDRDARQRRLHVGGGGQTKLDALAPGGSTHLQSIQLCAARSEQLFEQRSARMVRSRCLRSTLCRMSAPWRERSRLLGRGADRAKRQRHDHHLARTGYRRFPNTTAVTLVVPPGQTSASTAATLTVPAGERITATSNALWNHNGLVLRARLRA